MEFINMLLYLLPMLFIAGIFYLVLDKFLKNQPEIKNYKNNETIILQKLQAYERMALFLERIKPTSLVRRFHSAETPQAYEYLLISNIQDEFEHNLSQQIYIKSDTWNTILSVKNTLQNFIKDCKNNVKEDSVEALQKIIITNSAEYNQAISNCLEKLRTDINHFK